MSNTDGVLKDYTVHHLRIEDEAKYSVNNSSLLSEVKDVG